MLSWKAVLFGAITDLAGSILAFNLLVVVWAHAYHPGVIADEAAIKATEHNPLFLAVFFTAGWYFDYLGGKVAGKVAKQQGLLHGIAAAIPGVILSLVNEPSPDDFSFPIWFAALSYVISLACSGYGGARAVQAQEPGPT